MRLMIRNRSCSRQQAKQEGDNEMIARINYEFPKGMKFTEFTELGAENAYIMAVIDDALQRGAGSVTVSRSSIEEIWAESYEIGENDGQQRGYDDLIDELGSMNAAERNEYITKEYEALRDTLPEDLSDDLQEEEAAFQESIDKSIEAHEALKKKFGKIANVNYA